MTRITTRNAMTRIVTTHYRSKPPPRKRKAGHARDDSREVKAFLARIIRPGGLWLS